MKRLYFLCLAALLAVSVSCCSDNPLKRYDFVYAGEWDTRNPDKQSMFIVRNGKVDFQYSIPLRDEWGRVQEFDDIKMLPNGNIVYAAMSQLGIVTQKGELVWQYICPQGTESHTCQPLDAERVYFSANGNPARIVIYNWKKEEVEKEIPIPTAVTSTHAQLRHVRITPEGNFTVGLMGERRILEIAPDGSIVNAIDNVKAWHVEKLPGGHYLIAGDNTCCVKELDMKGNTVWELTQDDVPFTLHNIQTAQKLPNGNILFNDWIAGQDESTWAGTVQFCEITPDKKIVWMLSSWENPDLGPSTAIEIIK